MRGRHERPGYEGLQVEEVYWVVPLDQRDGDHTGVQKCLGTSRKSGLYIPLARSSRSERVLAISSGFLFEPPLGLFCALQLLVVQAQLDQVLANLGYE